MFCLQFSTFPPKIYNFYIFLIFSVIFCQTYSVCDKKQIYIQIINVFAFYAGDFFIWKVAVVCPVLHTYSLLCFLYTANVCQSYMSYQSFKLSLSRYLWWLFFSFVWICFLWEHCFINNSAIMTNHELSHKNGSFRRCVSMILNIIRNNPYDRERLMEGTFNCIVPMFIYNLHLRTNAWWQLIISVMGLPRAHRHTHTI